MKKLLFIFLLIPFYSWSQIVIENRLGVDVKYINKEEVIRLIINEKGWSYNQAMLHYMFRFESEDDLREYAWETMLEIEHIMLPRDSVKYQELLKHKKSTEDEFLEKVFIYYGHVFYKRE